MSDTEMGLYFLKLSFTSPPGKPGGAAATLALTVLASTGAMNGKAKGVAADGSQKPTPFSVGNAVGAIHSTDSSKTLRVGSVFGDAWFSGGGMWAPFNASFSIDAAGAGQGQLDFGNVSYNCDVKLVG